MKNFKDVVPVPGGQKVFVTAKSREDLKTKTGIIIPDGAKQIELLDVQEVVEVGLYLHAEKQNNLLTIEPGDTVKINWESPHFYKPKTKDAFEKRKNGVEDTVRSTEFEFTVPMATFNGRDVLLVDKNDIDWVWKADTLSEEG